MNRKNRRIWATKDKSKSSDRLVNILTLALLVGIFIFCAVAIYFKEMHSSEKNEIYLNNLPSIEDTISHANVCMEDDLYSSNARKRVLIINKTYYGCNQKAIKYLSSNESLRFAIDPVNKATIDKATAIISLHPEKNGKVIYFGSKQTYNTYLMALKLTKEKEVEFNNK